MFFSFLKPHWKIISFTKSVAHGLGEVGVVAGLTEMFEVDDALAAMLGWWGFMTQMDVGRFNEFLCGANWALDGDKLLPSFDKLSMLKLSNNFCRLKWYWVLAYDIIKEALYCFVCNILMSNDEITYKGNNYEKVFGLFIILYRKNPESVLSETQVNVQLKTRLEKRTVSRWVYSKNLCSRKMGASWDFSSEWTRLVPFFTPLYTLFSETFTNEKTEKIILIWVNVDVKSNFEYFFSLKEYKKI